MLEDCLESAENEVDGLKKLEELVVDAVMSHYKGTQHPSGMAIVHSVREIYRKAMQAAHPAPAEPREGERPDWADDKAMECPNWQAVPEEAIHWFTDVIRALHRKAHAPAGRVVVDEVMECDQVHTMPNGSTYTNLLRSIKTGFMSFCTGVKDTGIKQGDRVRVICHKI